MSAGPRKFGSIVTTVIVRSIDQSFCFYQKFGRYPKKLRKPEFDYRLSLVSMDEMTGLLQNIGIVLLFFSL